MAAFLLGEYKPGRLQHRPTAAVLPGLVDAVMEINGFFVESKAYLRSYMLSVYATEDFAGNISHVRHSFNSFLARIDIGQVFDSFSGTLGYAYEISIMDTNHNGNVDTKIRSYLQANAERKYIHPEHTTRRLTPCRLGCTRRENSRTAEDPNTECTPN
jgi:hypothetical protein